MKTAHLIRSGAVAAVAAFSIAAASVVVAMQPVDHRSGGVTVEDLEEMKRAAADYSTEILFAAKGSGAYLAAIDVTVRSLPDRDVVLQHVTEGPLLLAELPPGRYEITATAPEVRPGARATLTRSFDVPQRGHARLALAFDTGDEVSADAPTSAQLQLH